MSYNFKSLGEVELLNTMPETANIFVEMDGNIRRAPQIQPVDEIIQIVGSETLEEVPEGATILAEVNGEIKRVPSDGLGGGNVLIITSSDYANAMAGVATAGAIAVTYTANMTYDEVVTALANCELVNARLFFVTDFPTTAPVLLITYDTSTYATACLIIVVSTMSNILQLYWTADGGISTTAPSLPPN